MNEANLRVIGWGYVFFLLFFFFIVLNRLFFIQIFIVLLIDLSVWLLWISKIDHTLILVEIMKKKSLEYLHKSNIRERHIHLLNFNLYYSITERKIEERRMNWFPTSQNRLQITSEMTKTITRERRQHSQQHLLRSRSIKRKIALISRWFKMKKNHPSHQQTFEQTNNSFDSDEIHHWKSVEILIRNRKRIFPIVFSYSLSQL